MSEANFTYDGHVTLNTKSQSQDHQDIRILAIEHMIPINVICELDGVENVLVAYIDYSTNQIHIPPDTRNQLRDTEQFKSSLLGYLTERTEEEHRRHDEMYEVGSVQEFEFVQAPSHERPTEEE